MLNTKALYAQLFLGCYFIRRLLRRLLFLKSPGLNEFIEFYRADKISPLNKNDKELFKRATLCISCGLCDSFAVAGLAQPSFVPRLSRSIPNFVGNSGLEASKDYRAAEWLCPTGVPLKKLIHFIQDKENEILKPAAS